MLCVIKPSMVQAWRYTAGRTDKYCSLLHFYSGQCDNQQTLQVLKAISSCQQPGQSSSKKHSLQGLSHPKSDGGASQLSSTVANLYAIRQ